MRTSMRSLMVVVATLALLGVPAANGAVAAGDVEDSAASTLDPGPGLVWGPDAQAAFDSLAQGGVVRFNDFEDIPSGLHRKLRLQGPDGDISVELRTTKLRWPPPPRGAPSGAPVVMLPYDFVKEPAVHRLMGVTKVKVGKGKSKFVPDGQSRFELVLDPPVSHVGFMRPWNTWSVTRFYDASGGLLAEHRNTVNHEFVGYVADTQEENVRRIVLDGVPSQPDDEYNKLYMAGTIEDLYLSGGRPAVGADQEPADAAAGSHPDDLVIDAPGGAFEGLAGPEAGEATDDDTADVEPEQASAREEPSVSAFAGDGLDVGELVEFVKLAVTDQSLTRDQLRFVLKTMIAQDDYADVALTAMIMYELLFSEDDAQTPAAGGSAGRSPAEDSATAPEPPDDPQADTPSEPEPDTSDVAVDAAQLPTDPSIGVTDVGGPIGYDALEGLSDGTGQASDAAADVAAPIQPRDPPPKMKPKHAKAGRTWVSVEADHEVRGIVAKVDPETKQQTGWKTKGTVTLQAGTWYQMKESKNRALYFYDTTGKPVGVAGSDGKRGLQTETWTPPQAESP